MSETATVTTAAAAANSNQQKIPHNIHTAGEMREKKELKENGRKNVYNTHLVKYATKCIHIINVTLSHALTYSCLGRAMKR